MARQDQLTKKRGRSANNVSHSKRRTKTKKELNLQVLRVTHKGKKVKLRVTAKTLKTIAKKGLDKVLKKYNIKKL